MTSDQLELLFAFEHTAGLTELAETMAKDPSGISRALQKIAEDYPVLTKIKGRWELTPLGRQINVLGKEWSDKQHELLSSSKIERSRTTDLLLERSTLVVVNAQKGLLDATQAGRNNSQAETNIAKLLQFWRLKKWPVVHVKHVSDNVSSIFYRQSTGCDFLLEAMPVSDEIIIEKAKSSAFDETELEGALSELGVNNLFVVGFTANECIDATVRDASSRNFSTYVVGDATAMFDLKDANGKLLKAERVHRLTLANISAFYAKVIQTKDIC